ncbi:uncharacterized protein PSFLO_04373 [Pseudozyma flocculosa]|uniref:Zinc-ribbon 15 domain-containing protein n=1 Tax=Pseudozyma flocculosa TaxID=84751 RepID=A0A5C3F319_9BASI|nr:uncharacterized protein PSFLO_04373 [Pseudozyma flocculosa]
MVRCPSSDFCFFIPVIFGCPTKIKPEGSGGAYVCPRCHNAQVVTAKSRTWFELCWIPLIPLKKKHIYICGICQWQTEQGGGFQPQQAMAGGGGYHGPPPGGQGGYGGYGPPQGYGGYPPK